MIGDDRRIVHDWHDGTVPANVSIHPEAFLETTYSFRLYNSVRREGVRLDRAAAVYAGTMFDIGRQGRVTLGEFAMCNGVRIICDAEVSIGDYALISWNVVLMDTYRLPLDPVARRSALTSVHPRAGARPSSAHPAVEARPIRIGRAAWIGFDACVLPGVTVGDAAVVGARSVVVGDVEPFTIVAGNPARLVRRVEPEDPFS